MKCLADLGADKDVIERHGTEAVAEMVSTFANLAAFARPVLINGAVGVLIAPEGKPFALNAYTVVDDKITAIHILADPARISQHDLPAIED